MGKLKVNCGDSKTNTEVCFIPSAEITSQNFSEWFLMLFRKFHDIGVVFVAIKEMPLWIKLRISKWIGISCSTLGPIFRKKLSMFIYQLTVFKCYVCLELILIILLTLYIFSKLCQFILLSDLTMLFIINEQVYVFIIKILSCLR